MPGLCQFVLLGRPETPRLTFLQENSLEQRILVPEHQALISGGTMTLLEGPQSVFVLLDRCLELLDVLGSTFPERRLGLSVALLALL